MCVCGVVTELTLDLSLERGLGVSSGNGEPRYVGKTSRQRVRLE